MNTLLSLSGHLDLAYVMLTIGCTGLIIGVHFFIIHLVSKYGERLGRGYGLWFLLSLFFSPLVILLVLAILGDNTTQSPQQEQQHTNENGWEHKSKNENPRRHKSRQDEWNGGTL